MTLRLVLWDVDHTLIEGGPFGRAVYRAAFERLTGSAPVEGPRTDGRTDLAIMADLFEINEMEPAPPRDILAALAEAAGSLREQLVAGGRALPGAAACLAALAARNDVVQSVLTGNIEPNARLKLSTFGLGQHLDYSLGGYGSDSTVRAELVPIARRKVAARHGVDPGPDGTLLIGDTLRDVEAGRDGGARVLGVATGAVSASALRAAGADAALDDLADVPRVLATVDALLGR